MSVVPINSNRAAEVGVVQAASERIKLRMKRTAEDIVAIGIDLQEIKDNLPHGEFLPWIDAEFGMAERSAQMFINVADRYGAKSAIIADLTPTVIYELSAPSTPEPVRQIIEAKAENGEKVSAKEVQELKRRLKEQQKVSDKKLKATEQTLDEVKSEVQTLKDSQELAKIKAKEEAQEAAKKELDELKAKLQSEQASKQHEIDQLQKQMATVKKEALTDAEKQATAILKEKMDEKEADLKKMRSNIKDAERKLESLERQKSKSKEMLKKLSDQARKIASVDWEAKSLLEDLDKLAKQMTQVLLTIEGLEHEHNASTLKVANQTAIMCEKLAIALKMVPEIESK